MFRDVVNIVGTTVVVLDNVPTLLICCFADVLTSGKLILTEFWIPVTSGCCGRGLFILDDSCLGF